MRGELPKEKLEEIESKLPVVDSRSLLIYSQSLGVAIHDIKAKGNLGEALVCFEDAIARFKQVRMALHETYAGLIWYRELTPNAPNEITAVFVSKFYLDYAALILYAIGEDVAAFVTSFLNIEKQVKKFWSDEKRQNKSVSSNAAKVGLYLDKNLPDHPLTQHILELRNNDDWRKALKYRNTWVHEKPPIIKDLGITYSRRSRRTKKVGGKVEISLGGGSLPDHSIDELLVIVHSATHTLSKVLSKITELILQEREKLGDSFDFDQNKINYIWNP